MEKNTILRETAKIMPLSIILKGEFRIQSGWNPNYVRTSLGKISRVNIIGVVVSIVSSFQFFIDDGTASIKVNDFSSLISNKNLKIGDSILLIGRLRQFENEICVVPEIINKSQTSKNKKWFEFRKNYLENLLSNIQDLDDAVLESNIEEDYSEIEVEQKPTPEIIEFHTPSLNDVKEVLEEKLTHDLLISFIKSNDSGKGCPIDLILSTFKEKETELILNDLISMGEIFEIKPGFLKVL